MFPLAALSAIPWRLVGFIAAGTALIVFGWRVHVWHESHKELPKVQASLELEVECAEGSKCAERVIAMQAAHEAIDQQVVRDYEQKLAEITARPAPVSPVRLCRPARSSSVRVSSPSAPAGASGGEKFSTEVGRDIAVELYRLADDADTEALKLRMLWERDMALASGENNAAD